MVKFSSILAKTVLSKTDACIIGSIKDVYFSNDFQRAEYVQIANGNVNRYAPFSAIASIKDAIIINADDLKDENEIANVLIHNTLDLPVYTNTGEYKGAVCDAELSNVGKVISFSTQDFQFSPSSIFALKDVIMLKSSQTQKRKSTKVRIPRPKTDYPVFILENGANDLQSVEYNINDKSAAESAPVISASATLASAPPVVSLSSDTREPMFSKGALESIIGNSIDDGDDHAPTRVICNYDFLIGRVLSADLLSFNGTLIAKSNSVVDDDLLTKARKAGKLVELTINSH